MRVHQHGADRPLSRRRAAGGELRAGARGGGSRAHHRHRSGAAAPAQPDPAAADPLQDRGRHDLRQRRFPPIFDKALALADYAEVQEAQARVGQAQASCAASASPAILEHAGAHADRERVARFPGGGKLVLGIGVQSTGQGHATIYPRLHRRRSSASRRRRSTHRHGDTELRPERHAVGRLALDHDGRQRARRDGRPDAGEGQEDRGRHAGSRRGRHPVPRRRTSRSSAPTARVALFEVARAAAQARSAKRSTPRRRPRRRRPSRTAATSPRSRSIRTPATVDIVAYTAVDDCGVVLDHTLVEGQVLGALAQGPRPGADWRTPSTTRRAASSSPARSWTTRMPRAHDMPSSCARRCTACRRPPTRSASKASARPAPPRSIAAIMNAIAQRDPERRRRPHRHAGDAREGVGGVPEGNGGK